jgi:hypothetical protein
VPALQGAGLPQRQSRGKTGPFPQKRRVVATKLATALWQFCALIRPSGKTISLAEQLPHRLRRLAKVLSSSFGDEELWR